MPDMLVKLYDLPPPPTPLPDITVRRPMPHEKAMVIGWIRKEFGEGWAGECEAAFARQPVTCFIASDADRIVGFAGYECTCRGFFGPTGVTPTHRSRGIGTALLFRCLQAMKEYGYAYAVVGGAGPADYYRKTVGADIISGSEPGIYPARPLQG